MKSYSDVRLGLFGRLNELRMLRRLHLADSGQRVDHLIDDARKIESLCGEETLAGRRILEIGAGQCPAQLAYFSGRNNCTGIDLDLVPHRLTLATCARILRRNGVMRMIKTVGRKAMKVDEALDRAVKTKT